VGVVEAMRELAISASLARADAPPRGQMRPGQAPALDARVRTVSLARVIRQDFDLRAAAFETNRKRIGELTNKPAVAAKHAKGQEL